VSLNKEIQQRYMLRALELARKGRGRTSPNPMVGVVVVKKGRVVGEGYHKKAGAAHAEIEALEKAGGRAQGADLFINLEPCCHHGKTPPCTEALLQAGIRRVIVGMTDPNPQVSGRGIRRLRRQGVEVVSGVLKKDCQRLNENFVKYMRTGRPFVILKTAMSLDGKIATRSGHSKWITGPRARQWVHELRNEVDAILVGTGTVLKDNPSLTTRLQSGPGKHPVRVILDSGLRIPLTRKVYGKSGRAIVAVGPMASAKKIQKLHAQGVETLALREKTGGLDLKQLLGKLGQLELTSVLLEGGSELAASAIQLGLVDRVAVFIAPIFIGGKEAPGPLGGAGIAKIQNALAIKNMTVREIGKDLLVEGNL